MDGRLKREDFVALARMFGLTAVAAESVMAELPGRLTERLAAPRLPDFVLRSEPSKMIQ